MYRILPPLRSSTCRCNLLLDEHGYLATVERAGEVEAGAVRTPPFGLVITRTAAEALDALVDDLTGVYDSSPSVLGPEPTVSAFAERWAQRFGTRTRSIMQMRLFETRGVLALTDPPPGVLTRGRHWSVLQFAVA